MSLLSFAPGMPLVDGYDLLAEFPFHGSADRHWRVRGPEGARLWRMIDLSQSADGIDHRTLELLPRLRHLHLDPIHQHFHLRARNLLILESDIPETTAGERLRRECRPISPMEATRWLGQAAAALDYLNGPNHSWQGSTVALFHRNLHPDALLLHKSESGLLCRVGDLGLAKPSSTAEAANSRGLGRYQYDAPELYEGRVSGASDQYSLAIIYVEMRTGKPPYAGSMLVQLEQRLKGLADLSGLPAEEAAVVRRALSRDPLDRFASCEDFALRVAAVQKSAGAQPQTPGRPPSVTRTGGSRASGMFLRPESRALEGARPASIAGTPAGAAPVSRPEPAPPPPLEFPTDTLAPAMVALIVVGVVAAFALAYWLLAVGGPR